MLSLVLHLSAQDQVDTLTFQNESLKDKAKRFEEALRRSTDEQIIVSKEDKPEIHLINI